MYFDDVTVGFLIIGASMVAGMLFCFAICVVLWIKYKEGALPSLWSKIVFRQRSVAYDRTPTELPPSEILVFPTISYSETGSEPCSPMSNMSTSSPLTPHGGRTFQTFLYPPEKIHPKTGSPSNSQHSLSSINIKPKSMRASECLGVPASPSSSKLYAMSDGSVRPKTSRPCSLVLRSPSFTSTGPSSESGTSASPPELESFRTHLANLDFFSKEEDYLTTSKTGFKPPQPFFLSSLTDSKHKFKIGTVRVNLKYSCAENTLQVNLLREFQLPYHVQCKEADLYAKFNLVIGDSRIRCSKPLSLELPEFDGQRPDVCATFESEAKTEDLSEASVVITLCKRIRSLEQGMVIGSAFVNIREFDLSDSEDFDSGVLELPLGDSNPHQMIYCGGVLQGILSLPYKRPLLILSNIRLCEMDLSKLSPDKDPSKAHIQDQVQLYLKITIYEKGEAVFWRRSTPVVVSTSSSEALLATHLALDMSLKKLGSLQLVVSVRLKTGRRGERCVLGNIYMSESWFNKEIQLRRMDESLSSQVVLHLPLDH